jgi:O-antigen ligase
MPKLTAAHEGKLVCFNLICFFFKKNISLFLFSASLTLLLAKRERKEKAVFQVIIIIIVYCCFQKSFRLSTTLFVLIQFISFIELCSTNRFWWQKTRKTFIYDCTNKIIYCRYWSEIGHACKSDFTFLVFL